MKDTKRKTTQKARRGTLPSVDDDDRRSAESNDGEHSSLPSSEFDSEVSEIEFLPEKSKQLQNNQTKKTTTVKKKKKPRVCFYILLFIFGVSNICFLVVSQEGNGDGEEKVADSDSTSDFGPADYSEVDEDHDLGLVHPEEEEWEKHLAVDMERGVTNSSTNRKFILYLFLFILHFLIGVLYLLFL